jgi:predicted nucleotidyltransferase
VKILGPELVSVVLYGSWARGTATVDSDIDLLIIAERLPGGRWDRQDLAVRARRLKTPLADEVFASTGWYAYPSILLKTRREADGFHRLYLDMVGEARMLLDKPDIKPGEEFKL